MNLMLSGSVNILIDAEIGFYFGVRWLMTQ